MKTAKRKSEPLARVIRDTDFNMFYDLFVDGVHVDTSMRVDDLRRLARIINVRDRRYGAEIAKLEAEIKRLKGC